MTSIVKRFACPTTRMTSIRVAQIEDPSIHSGSSTVPLMLSLIVAVSSTWGKIKGSSHVPQSASVIDVRKPLAWELFLYPGVTLRFYVFHGVRLPFAMQRKRLKTCHFMEPVPSSTESQSLTLIQNIRLVVTTILNLQ